MGSGLASWTRSSSRLVHNGLLQCPIRSFYIFHICLQKEHLEITEETVLFRRNHRRKIIHGFLFLATT